MSIYCKDRTAVVECVEGFLKMQEETDSPWTIVIKPEASEGYSVSGAISLWSEGTRNRIRTFFGLRTITLTPNTQGG